MVSFFVQNKCLHNPNTFNSFESEPHFNMFLSQVVVILYAICLEARGFKLINNNQTNFKEDKFVIVDSIENLLEDFFL